MNLNYLTTAELYSVREELLEIVDRLDDGDTRHIISLVIGQVETQLFKAI